MDSGSVDLKHKYTGQEEDGETGLYYYGARYYDPNLARFISPDSIVPDHTDPQSLNRYSYCINNPLLYVDPTGNSPSWTWNDSSSSSSSSGHNYQSLWSNNNSYIFNTSYMDSSSISLDSYSYGISSFSNQTSSYGSFSAGNYGIGSSGLSSFSLDLNSYAGEPQLSPPNTGYADLNLSGGCWGVGITAGVMYQPGTGQYYPYLGGGAMFPGVSASLTFGLSAPTTGWNYAGQLQGGGAIQVGYSRDSREWYMEPGVALGTPGGALTGFYVFGPKVLSDPNYKPWTASGMVYEHMSRNKR